MERLPGVEARVARAWTSRRRSIYLRADARLRSRFAWSPTPHSLRRRSLSPSVFRRVVRTRSVAWAMVSDIWNVTG